MSTVQIDTVEQASLSGSATDFSIVRRIILQGVTESNSGNYWEKIINAYNDDNVPAIGDPWPVNGTDVYPDFQLSCVSKDVNPIPGESSSFEVLCTYGMRDATMLPPLIQNAVPNLTLGQTYAKKTIQTSTISRQTNRLYGELTVLNDDDYGNPNLNSYGDEIVTISLKRENQDPKSLDRPAQSALVDEQKPIIILKYQRNEIVDERKAGTNQDHTQKINSAEFGGFKARSVLFSSLTYEPLGRVYRIEGTSGFEGRQTYLATYEFQFNFDFWIKEFYYIDPEKNLPIADADFDGTDDKTYMQYLGFEEYDFNAFNLEQP